VDRPDEPRLPRDHPLRGCEEKLWRAKEHFDTLQEEIGKLQDTELATFRGELDPDRDDVMHIVVDTVTMPDLRIAVILGDMVHNLRSSLDHLVFELAFLGLRGKSIPDKTAFPASTTRANWRTSYVQNKLLEGVLKKHRAMLYRAQPCYRKRDSVSATTIRRRKRSPAADLNDLWNEDKHRVLRPVLLAPNELVPSVGPYIDCRPRGMPIIYSSFLGKPVKPEAKVLSIPVVVTGPNPTVGVQIELAGNISLRNGFPVLEATATIATWVQGLLAWFEPQFETPQARRLWDLPRGGWVERPMPVYGRARRRGWKVPRAQPSSPPGK
jgi:hypothetical protein